MNTTSSPVREREREGGRKRDWEREGGRKRDWEREGGRKRESEKEGEIERERERGREVGLLFLVLKGMTGALAPFSYLVLKKRGRLDDIPKSFWNLT